MAGNFDTETLWKVASAYKVARNFPFPIREQWTTLLREIRGPTREEDPYEWFVLTVRELAEQAANLRRGEKPFRPLSGASKLLWHRFPTTGFIYDSQARQGLARAGLLSPFYDRLERWGGPSSDQREIDFLQFAAAYERYRLPEVNRVQRATIQHGLDTPQATRFLDKLLWLFGSKQPSEAIRKSIGRMTLVDKEIARDSFTDTISCLIERLTKGVQRT